MKRKNKGITLIALVITIIVLLILAGVALSLVAGNEGILGKAETSVVKTNEASAKEQAELLIAEITADYYEARYVNKTESSDLSTYIKNAFGAGKATSNGEFFVTLAEDGTTLTVYSGNSAESAIEANALITGSLSSKGKATWNASSSGATGGSGIIGETYYGDGSVVPTDQKYFTFETNEDDQTATITGIKDEYAVKAYYALDGSIIYGERHYQNCAINDGGRYITDIAIPYEYVDENGTKYAVTSIGEVAFGPTLCGGLGVYEADYRFTSIKIPNTIISIGYEAFAKCTSLSSIKIPEGVTSIGYSAFYGCTSLTSVIIDSETIASGLTTSQTVYGYLINNATTVYVKSGLTVGAGVTDNFTEATTSDKEGYVMYTK